MKFVHTVIMIICVSFLTFSQDKKKELTKALSYVSTGTSFTTAGNFAALSTTDNTLKGSLFFLDEKEHSMFTVNFSAGAVEGISVLFDEGKLNSKVTLGGDYRVLLNIKNQLLGFPTSTSSLLNAEIQKIEENYNNKMFELIKLSHSGRTNFVNDPKMVKKLKTVDSIIAIYEGISILQKKNLSRYDNSVKNRIKALKVALIDKMGINIDSIYYRSISALYSNEKNQKIEAIKDQLNNIKPTHIRMSFLSFGYSATREDFKLFIDSLPLDKQLKSVNYISHNIKASYNFISNIDKELDDTNRLFFSAGFQFSYTNNLSSLKKIEVVDTKIVDSMAGRTYNTKQNALKGDYKEDIDSINLFVDYYKYLSKDSNSIAIHLSPRVLISDFAKPISTLQFGILLPFKDKNKQASSVNVELFYKINDVFNTSNNSNALLNRNQIGFQTTFPFNF